MCQPREFVIGYWHKNITSRLRFAAAARPGGREWIFQINAELEPLLASPNGTQSFGTTAAVAVATLSIDKKKGHTLCALSFVRGVLTEVVADIFREATQRRLPCIGNGLC